MSSNDPKFIGEGSDIKYQYPEVEEQPEAKKESKTWLWILLAVIVIVIILFAGGILIYFLFFNSEPLHEITILNNNPNSQTKFYIGATGTTQRFGPITLEANSSIKLLASPGVSLYVAPLDGLGNQQTRTILALAGKDQDGTGKMVYNGTTISNISLNKLTQDRYGVSVQTGFSTTMSIYATENFKESACDGPSWTNTITEDSCPSELKLLTSGGAYVACQSACKALGASGNNYCCNAPNSCSQNGGCQSTWDDYDFYTTFSDPCPNCMITNCDTLNYTCTSKSSSNLTKYTIVISPNIV